MTATSKQCKPKNTDAKQQRYEYLPINDIRTNNGRNKHNRKQKKRMQEKTESVVHDYKYECLDKSGVLSLDDTLCDVKCWTNRPADWFRASIKYYTNLYDDGALTHKPSIKLSKRGDQLRIYGETDQECHISIFIYKTGVVLIQGSGCGEWENRDMSHIKSLLHEDDSSCEPSPIKVLHQDTPSRHTIKG